MQHCILNIMFDCDFKKALASDKLNMGLNVYSVLCTSHCDGGKNRNDNYTMQQNLSMSNGHTHEEYYSFLNKHRKISHSCHAQNVVALRFQSIRKQILFRQNFLESTERYCLSHESSAFE